MIDATLAVIGVIGARQAGAGLGGRMVVSVASDEVTAFARDVRERSGATTGIMPEIGPCSPPLAPDLWLSTWCSFRDDAPTAAALHPYCPPG